MSEYIERQKALDTVFRSHSVEAAHKFLAAIKPADVRPVVQGKWIVRDNPGTGWYRVTCSECGEDVTSVIPVIGFFPNAKPSWDFCPNCGADMREES